MSRDPQQPQPYGEKGRKVDARLVVAAIVVVLLVAFVFQNTQTTDVHWLFFSFSAPLWVMLAITIALSLVVGFFVGRRSRPDRR